MKKILSRRLFAVSLLAVGTFFSTLHASAEDGVTDSGILLGQTIGVTGQIAGPVKEMMAGATAYFAYVNKNGGVHGRKIEVKTLDDKFDPALALSNADALIKKEHVFALFQSRGTPHTQAILPLLAEHKIPLIAPSTGAVTFHTPVNHYVFNVRAKYQDEVKKAVEQFATIGLKDIVLVHVDDSFGKDGLEGFQSAMQQFKLKPVSIISYDRAKPDIKAVAASVVQSAGKALILVTSGTTTAELINAIRDAGSTIQIMAVSNNSSQSFIDSLGKHATGIMVSQIVPAPHLLSSQLGQEFRQVTKEHHVMESYAAMEGFVSAKVMVEGLRRAGKNPTREGLIRALESIKRLDLGGLTLTYSEKDHTGSEFVELTMIGRDKRFIR